MAFWVVIAVFSGISSVSFAQISTQTDSTISQIKNLFDNGSYTTAELQARRVLEDKTVSDSARIQLEKYLGFALVAQGKNEAAIDHFVKALRADSSLTLDPVQTSPKILSVFETARQEYESEVQSAKPALQGRPGEKWVSTSETATFRAILFPGWDQIHRGRETKGYILLGAGAAAAVSAIASDLLRRNARTNYLAANTPELAASRYNTYNLYSKTEFYSISAFVVIYLYSELDSFLSLPPHFSADYKPSTHTVSLSFRLGF